MPLLADDGSDRASAALHPAEEFCRSLELPLTVIHVSRDQSAGAAVLEEANQYLAAYNLQVTSELLSGPPHQRIVDTLQDRNFDLLFIGAFGHSRIVEMVRPGLDRGSELALTHEAGLPQVSHANREGEQEQVMLGHFNFPLQAAAAPIGVGDPNNEPALAAG